MHVYMIMLPKRRKHGEVKFHNVGVKSNNTIW